MGKRFFSGPPRLLVRLFYLVVVSEEKRTIFGDLDELFGEIAQEKGRLRAVVWYGGQILSSLPIFVLGYVYWRISMFKNYLKISLRNIQKHKAYSIINIAGLALGIACCILILLWVQDELSYDRFHENARDLYAATFSNGSTVTPTALGPFLKTEYPEVLHTSRYSGQGRNLLKFGNTEVYESGGIMVDPDFIKMFTIPFVSGDHTAALNNPTSILLSETLAGKLFGGQNPIGRTVLYNTQVDLIVSGVLEDYPPNSHIEFEYILPMSLAGAWGRDLETWSVNNIRTYVQLQKGTQVPVFDAKISDVVEKHRPQDQRPLSMQPILRLHLNPFQHSGGPIIYVYIFSFMAFFILLIACINFINLTTAKSSNRAKEVGIRKTVGACRIHLIRQFYGESLLLTLIALAAGLGLVFLCLPQFNQLTSKTFTWQDVGRQSLILGILGILPLTVLIAGSYPALFLSRFQAVKVLKGKLVAGMKGASFRKVLVVLQFSLSVLLILGSLMVFRQVHFLREYDVGFDRENIVYFGIGSRFRQNIDTIKTELLSNPDIRSITLTDIAPYRWQSNAGVGDVHWEGKTDQQVKMVMTTVDYDYLETFGLELAEGRFFAKEYSTDATDAYVVNQAAVRAMEMDNPLGKELKVWDRRGLIIGVLKDYHFESLHDEIIPMAMRIDPAWFNQACVRIAPRRLPETLAFLEQKWEQIYPQYPFEYRFLEETIHDQYRSEESTGKIVTVFTMLAIVISCLGIFGLSSYTAEQRTKEIGIRKVLGASVASVIRQISREFVLLVVIANVLIWPVSYLLMRLWLQSFAYRTPIGLWPFLATGAAILCLSFLTVSWQIIRAATSNPVDALRYE
jgi:putative ABC transport system permease protein